MREFWRAVKESFLFSVCIITEIYNTCVAGVPEGMEIEGKR